MKQYLNLLDDILTEGTDRDDRTGVGTRSVFGRQLRFDLQEGFPAVTTKKLFFSSVAHELIWFISGDTDISYLRENDVHIWDEWGPDVGPLYGNQWRHWGGDQLKQTIEQVRENPESRRHLVSAWNVDQLDEMALYPCHVMFQFYVADGRLSTQVYQRSADVFLGLPFNIASYSLLTHMVADVTGLQPGDLVHTVGDAHLYQNHFDQAREQLSREPYERPALELASRDGIDDFEFDDIELVDYEYHPHIKAPIAHE